MKKIYTTPAIEIIEVEDVMQSHLFSTSNPTHLKDYHNDPLTEFDDEDKDDDVPGFIGGGDGSDIE